ncbi:hypothetical protein M9H77_07442 [Catharanthus roseus]|uniref:Uncharacterized protein n=1 Tax=Catharanthus roseus TaxID=4058 RepID=A0ACC0BUY0_CATRO|nr:hypothetical protein M9H77_07442 [Catharanthus roseus]
MVKTKNANVGREGHGEAGGSSRGGKKGKSKQVARSETPLDKFISVQAAANYEDWTLISRLIDHFGMAYTSHILDQVKTLGFQQATATFISLGILDLSTIPLKVEEKENRSRTSSRSIRHGRGRAQSGGNVVTSRVNGKIIAFDDRLLNSILETHKDGMHFYTKNKKCLDPNLYSEKRFEDLFTKGIVLKRSEDRTINKLDAYGRILHHIISNIVIPNVGHKSSITNMHSFVMLAMHEHRKMIFDVQSKHLQEDGILKYEERKLIRGGQEEDSENSEEEEEEEEEEGNEPEESDTKMEVERIRRETRRKKR